MTNLALGVAARPRLRDLREARRETVLHGLPGLAGEGVAAGDIAQRLGLSHGTVRNYLSEIIGKLGVSNRIEAYRMARQKGWL